MFTRETKEKNSPNKSAVDPNSLFIISERAPTTSSQRREKVPTCEKKMSLIKLHHSGVAPSLYMYLYLHVVLLYQP
jgi:hypothetical protein